MWTTIIVYVLLAILGAVFGSFAVAQVWRIRAFQLKEDLELDPKSVDKVEWRRLKPLTEVNKSKDRSHCLSCGYQLRWFDLIPVFSWISLKGKCRKCHTSIGKTEIFGEIFLASLFALSAFFWPVNIFSSSANMFEIGQFVLWLVSLVILLILFIYDLKWSLLPLKQMLIFIAIAILFWSLRSFQSSVTIDLVINLIISMVILPGTYFVLNKMSDGQWVGSGDWIISIGLVFLLPNEPIYAAIVLFLSNFIGTIYILIMSMRNKTEIKRGVKIPFGPFLIIATIITAIFYPYMYSFLAF